MSDVVILRFRLTAKGSGYEVALTSEGFESADASFAADMLGGHLATVVGHIADNRARDEHLMYAGTALWASLASGDVGKRVDEIVQATEDRRPLYHVRLGLPQELRALPWETLYDERRVGFLSCAEDWCVVHDPPDRIVVPRAGKRADGPLRVLVAVPEGSGLDVGREWRHLQAEAERLGPDAIVMQRLEGRVTADKLGTELAKGWDVFHFIGHGGLDDQGRVTVRLNKPGPDLDETWLDAETFGLLFRQRPVRLAVLNSCLGAAQSAGPHLSGAAPFLMRNGVQGVVAMRWEIYEPDALNFSAPFYRELVRSGRVDRALEHARLQLKLHPHDESKRGFVTPVLYLVEGQERLFEPLEARTLAATPAAAPPPPALPALDLPPDLVAALSEGQVVPVIGPGLLRMGVVRGGAEQAPPGPRELAEILRERFDYPETEDFQAVDLAPWAAESLLQRVCQHCAHLHRGVFKIVQAIEEAYRPTKPPSAFAALARWRVPGMVYTFFDGLLAQAIQEQSRAFRVINSLTDPVQTDDRHPLLVHLKGCIADTSSLVLTEQEHERLWDRMDHLSGAVAGLATRRPGRSLVFVGVNPRDPVVRRFLRVLMGDETRRRLQGPSFFVAPHHSDVDQAYWDQYNTTWIDANPLDFIEAATAHAAGDGP
ncbi:MAG: hypothetical protein AMXMBFR53_01880 [Gemmatimonadota bacterium]